MNRLQSKTRVPRSSATLLKYSVYSQSGITTAPVVRNSICKRPRDLVGCGAHFIQVILKHVRDDRQPGVDYLMLIYALIIGANSHAFANKGIGTAFDSTVDDLYLF